MSASKSDLNGDIHRLHASPGRAYLNRAKQRTYSLNILQMNGLELVETVRRLSDPDDGLAFFSLDNREAGTQAQRELSRHFHNFLAAAKTLVDHTRVLMNEHYRDTPLLSTYTRKAGTETGALPVVKLVHDLRNYMLHRGLPNIEHFLNLEQNPAKREQGLSVQVGVRLPTSSLLSWDKWSPPARRFLDESGKTLDIKSTVEDYLAAISELHAWLDIELAQHHAEDLAEAQRLEHALQGHRHPSSEPGPVATEPEPFTFTPDQREALNQRATDLFQEVRPLKFASHGPGFPSLRPVETRVTDKDIIDTPVFRGPDADGTPVVSFIELGEEVLGMDADAFEGVADLARLAQQAAWASEGLDLQFVEDEFVAWARDHEHAAFADHLAEAARAAIIPRTVWVPIANFEVEEGFDFGPVAIASITPDVLATFRGRVEPKSEQEAAVTAYFEQLGRQMLGRAAVVVTLTAEPKFAQEKARLFARDAICLLRFFCPGAQIVERLCPIDLLGAEHVPGSHLLVDSADGFSSSSEIMRNVAVWQMPAAHLTTLQQLGLSAAGRLVTATGLSPFETDLRSSLMIYSRSLVIADVRHRLTQALAALESLLLRHQMEPQMTTTADRAAAILGEDHAARREIADLFRRAYRFLEMPLARPLWPHEIELAETVVMYAYNVLLTAIDNLSRFPTRDRFLDAVERRRGS